MASNRDGKSSFDRLPSGFGAEDQQRYGKLRATSGHLRPHAQTHGDRFIPVRGATDFKLGHHQLTNKDIGSHEFLVDEDRASGVQYKSILADFLVDPERGRADGDGYGHWCPGTSRSAWAILKYSAQDLDIAGQSPAKRLRRCSAGQPHSLLRQLFSESRTQLGTEEYRHRQISHTPERILDAPDLIDDFYLNVLDWSSKDVLAVALGRTVYLWHAHTCAISQLMQSAEGFVSSLRFSADGDQIAVGTTRSTSLYDVQSTRLVREIAQHSMRVSALAWNKHILSSGGRHSSIHNYDIRISGQSALHSTLQSHRQEVCGLAWSHDGKQLASGGNDNKVIVWDAAKFSSNEGSVPRFVNTQHRAAVKALAWSPHRRNLLVSGGGTTDQTIRFWNTSSGELRNTVDTKSQVCALQWSRHDEELVSSHGFSRNQLILWKYPTMTKMAELTGHTSRALHLAQSPDGETVVSGAADETLRFWKCFNPKKWHKHSKRIAGGKATGKLDLMTIR